MTLFPAHGRPRRDRSRRPWLRAHRARFASAHAAQTHHTLHRMACRKPERAHCNVGVAPNVEHVVSCETERRHICCAGRIAEPADGVAANMLRSRSAFTRPLCYVDGGFTLPRVTALATIVEQGTRGAKTMQSADLSALRSTALMWARNRARACATLRARLHVAPARGRGLRWAAVRRETHEC